VAAAEPMAARVVAAVVVDDDDTGNKKTTEELEREREHISSYPSTPTTYTAGHDS
jgi:hypothetical protein